MMAFALNFSSRFALAALFGASLAIAPAVYAQEGETPAKEGEGAGGAAAEVSREDQQAAEKLFKEAFKDYKKEQDGEALKALTDALNLWPTMPRGYYLLAEIHLMDGRVAKAEQAFTQAIKAEPDFAPAHDSLGVCHLIKREYGQAQKCFEQALEHDKRFSDAHLHMGMMYERQNKRREAEISYKTALKLSPKSVLAHRRLGFFYLQEKATDPSGQPPKIVEASREFLLVTKLTPTDMEALFAYAYCLDAQDKYSAAQKIYQKIVKIDPKQTEAWRNLGLTHQRKGSKKEIDLALEAYKNYVKHGGKDPVVKGWIRQIEMAKEEANK